MQRKRSTVPALVAATSGIFFAPTTAPMLAWNSRMNQTRIAAIMAERFPGSEKGGQPEMSVSVGHIYVTTSYVLYKESKTIISCRG